MYFGVCLTHSEHKKKDLDHFCIDCEKSFCCNCVSTHALHKYVKIRRYMYCEVIKRQDLCKLFDCSSIQQRSTQQPQQQNSKDHSCIICKKSLPDACFYCSIACKVSALCGDRHEETILDYKKTCKEEDVDLEKSRTRDDQDEGLENRRLKDGAHFILPMRKRRRSRKGKPRRAPLL
ncbi:PLATZ transcription factor family protein [Abeliophyllum distichum]|uniref:PLATZ transcription factor family protein n=1 Tax=Abeliophyllum distichum TaxID=126358 RepID=A0ABD1U183_9LAMI